MNKELLLKLLQNGIEISHFVILQLIATEKDLDVLWTNVKIKSYREALIRKGYIVKLKDEYYLTDKGSQIYNNCKYKKEILIEEIKNPIEEITKSILNICKSKIKEKTGKERYILPTGTNYLPSQKELEERLLKFCQKFKNNDFEKIKKAIFAYTEEILELKLKYPRKMKYFIYKEDDKQGLISDMLAYMETVEEKEIVKDTRLLF